jgi:hypothetical protein
LNDNYPVAAMTVNERLDHFGLYADFLAAVASREFRAVTEVLRTAELTDEQAHETAIAILANPARYGLR